MRKCLKCEFTQNTEDAETCVACGSLLPQVVVIELPAKEKLGVKLKPPKNGVIDHGLSIDNIDNPLLEGKVLAGDLIIAIGGTYVDQMGFSEAVDLIRKMPRPLAISFEVDEKRRAEVLAEKHRNQQSTEELDKELTTYAVVFDEGPMGLNLEEAVRYGIDGAVVKALKGQAKTNGQISIGDIVYKVNDTEALCMPYAEVMELLRKTPSPKTIQFVPKDKLADVQRVNSRHSESFRLRASTPKAKKFISSARMPKLESESDDNKSIAQLILDNQNATIKKGRMYKQGRVMRNWKSRYFVLSVSKIEYFKSPSSTTSRGELSFLDHRCSVRSLKGSSEVVCKSPMVVAEFLLELRVDDRKLVMACTSETDKKAWMDALKLAIDASKTVGRTASLGESLSLAKLRNQRSGSISAETFLDRNAGGRLSQFNYDAFPTPVVHVAVVSATNLTKSGSTVNALCEVTLNHETFKTAVVKNQRSPVWKQDNTASFEAPHEDMVIEIRLFDEHLFRSSELLASLTIPLKSLPNMEKATKNYPLALASRSAGAVLTLSLEYINKAKAFQEEQERLRLGDDLERTAVMGERDEMIKIQNEAQMAADEASRNAMLAEEEARNLLAQARKKAEAAMAAAREEQAQGKAAVEAAMAEAQRAKEEADHQAEEARRAQEEARKLIEANRRIQEQSAEATEGLGKSTQFGPYRSMVLDGASHDTVKERMREDGIDEMSIAAFFDGINSYDEKIRQLQAEVEKLRRRPKERTEPNPEEMYAHLDMDQVNLLRRLLKLEKQLLQAGIAVAADIPYEEAKAKVEEIARRMGEIGSADVTHPDPEIQRSLREEYYRLEQDMEKYNTALMLTDEYAAEEARKEREWEEENYEANIKALKAVRRTMPVNVKNMSENDLQSERTPNGKVLSREIARKYKRTNVLELLRMDPKDIMKSHPSSLENLRVTGLTVTERRALHLHLRDLGDSWKAGQNEELTKRKFEWFKTLKQTFKQVVNAYNRHVNQYGPADNHPVATRDDPDNGCPLIGKQCPIKADKSPPYDIDFGFPDGDIYMQSSVQKGDTEDVGAKALREAEELIRAQKANARADTLKKHYKNVRLAAEANGACDLIESTVDSIEGKQLMWFQRRLKNRVNKTETAATIKLELADFTELVNEVRLTMIKFSERSGMNLSGKRDPSTDSPDTRSSLECGLAILFCDAVVDALKGIEERMDEVQASDKRLRAAIPSIVDTVKELKVKSSTTLSKFKEKGPTNPRRVKTRGEILKEAKEKNALENGGSAAANGDANGGGGGPERPPHPLMAARGGRSARGRGNPLMAAIQGRGRAGDDEEGGGAAPPNDLMAAIKARSAGRGGNDLMSAIKARGDGGGRGNDLMSAIKARGGGGGRGNDLMSAIKARGEGRGRGAPMDLMSAIKARKKD